MAIHLIGVYPKCTSHRRASHRVWYIIDVYLIGVHLTVVHLIDVYLSKWRDAELLDLLSRREMYTFLYPLDARHPDPPAILPGIVYPNRTNS
jgi:hypothetical protein